MRKLPGGPLQRCHDAGCAETAGCAESGGCADGGGRAEGGDGEGGGSETPDAGGGDDGRTGSTLVVTESGAGVAAAAAVARTRAVDASSDHDASGPRCFGCPGGGVDPPLIP
jgi:hypothetical protein